MTIAKATAKAEAKYAEKREAIAAVSTAKANLQALIAAA